jgi:hypothetical protein
MVVLESAIVPLRRFRRTSSTSQSSSSSYINLNTSLRSCSASISNSVSVELIVSRMKGEVMTSTKYKCVIDALELIHFDGILLLLLHLLLTKLHSTLFLDIYSDIIIISRHLYISFIVIHIQAIIVYHIYRAIYTSVLHLARLDRDSLYRNQPEQPIPTISFTRPCQCTWEREEKEARVERDVHVVQQPF